MSSSQSLSWSTASTRVIVSPADSAALAKLVPRMADGPIGWMGD